MQFPWDVVDAMLNKELGFDCMLVEFKWPKRGDRHAGQSYLTG